MISGPAELCLRGFIVVGPVLPETRKQVVIGEQCLDGFLESLVFRGLVLKNSGLTRMSLALSEHLV